MGEVNLNSSQPTPRSSSPNRSIPRWALQGRGPAANPAIRSASPRPGPGQSARSPSQRLDCARHARVSSTWLPCPLLSPVRPALQKPEKLPSPRKKLLPLTRSPPSPSVSVRRRRSRKPPASPGLLAAARYFGGFAPRRDWNRPGCAVRITKPERSSVALWRLDSPVAALQVSLAVS